MLVLRQLVLSKTICASGTVVSVEPPIAKLPSGMNFTEVLSDNDTIQFGCDGSSYIPEGIASLRFQILIYLAYSSIFLVSIIGNIAVFLVVHLLPRMNTVTNLFIANLALGDMLMAIFCIPFSFVSIFVLQYWPFGAIICRIVNYSQAISVLVSAYTMIAISADRYIAIMWPLKPRVSKRLARILIVLVWTGALLTAAPIPVFSTLIQPTEWYDQCDLSICTEVWPDDHSDRSYSITLMTLQFLAPLIVLIFTYVQIAWKVWAKSPPGESVKQRDRRILQSKRKMIKMMITVVVVFTVCWLPFNIFMLIPLDPDWKPLPYLWFLFHWLAMSHSCYNPIIYCYMNARFRSGFILVLHGVPGLQQLCCCIRHKPSQLARNVGSSVALAGEMNGIYRDSALTRKARVRVRCHPD